jgi:hypothetical protein
MKRAFKWVGMLLLAYIIVFGSYFYYSLYSGSARMAKLCGQIKPGMAWRMTFWFLTTKFRTGLPEWRKVEPWGAMVAKSRLKVGW